MIEAAERFGGLARLLGRTAFDRVRRARVAVIGIGGVGSWVAEALARSGVGGLRLVDLDEVCLTNVNRQLHALSETVGRLKVEVMAERIRAIHPECAVEAVPDFFTAETAAAILEPPLDAVADAIDDARLKALLIARCRAANLPVVTSGGAGGRRDPFRLRAADLAFSSHDPLLAEVRRRLRRDYGFPPPGEPFGVDCVFSEEAPVFPSADGETCGRPDAGSPTRLDCRTGLGTAAFVTGAFGLAVAARIVHRLAGLARPG